MTRQTVCSICKERPVASSANSYCNPCRNEHYNREYYRRTKKERQKTRTKWRKALRAEGLAHYGGKCACCGEKTDQFLGIDHMEGGGNKHRATMGRVSIYYWLKKNDYPKGFQVLCHNCNLAKGFYGICPHQSK